MRRMLRCVLAGLVFAGLGGVAQADQSVERSTPFSDYRQAATDEYTVSPGPGGGNPPAGSGVLPGSDSTPGATSTPGADSTPGSGKTEPDQSEISPAVAENSPSSGGGVAGTTGSAPSSGLPFTGLDLLTIVLLGVLLVAAGLALAALARVRGRALAR